MLPLSSVELQEAKHCLQELATLPEAWFTDSLPSYLRESFGEFEAYALQAAQTTNTRATRAFLRKYSQGRRRMLLAQVHGKTPLGRNVIQTVLEFYEDALQQQLHP